MCYTVERSYLTGLRNVSQRTFPWCSWIRDRDPMSAIGADAGSNNSVSGSVAQLKTDHDRRSWSDWGVPGEELTFTITPAKSGPHQVLVEYGNAFGPINTGITAAVKQVEIIADGKSVTKGVVVMPHRSNWPDWGRSSMLPVDLAAGTQYTVKLSDYYNMSYLDSNRLYNNDGGAQGPKNRANIGGILLRYGAK